MTDCEAVPRIWGQRSLDPCVMPVGYRLLPRICGPSLLSQVGSQRGGCLVRVVVGLGLEPWASRSESMCPPCAAQTQEGDNPTGQATSSRVPTEPNSAESSLRAVPAHTTPASCKKRQVRLGRGLCTGGGGLAPQAAGVTADCRGTTGHDGVGGSVPKGLGQEGGCGPYMGPWRRG